MGPLFCALTESQLADLRAWAVTGAVRLYDAGAVSWEFLLDLQTRLGVNEIDDG